MLLQVSMLLWFLYCLYLPHYGAVSKTELTAIQFRLTTAFMQYLSGTGAFTEWEEDRKTWRGTDPIAMWDAFDTEGISELSNFAKILLTIVANQAGCERLFSDIGNTQGTWRTQLSLEKLEKITKVCNAL